MSKSRRTVHPPKQQRPTWLIPAMIIGALGAIAALFALLSGVFRSPYVPDVTGGPHIEVDQTSIDHGDQRFDTPVESVFRVRNVGDQPLVFLGEPQVELIEGC